MDSYSPDARSRQCCNGARGLLAVASAVGAASLVVFLSSGRGPAPQAPQAATPIIVCTRPAEAATAAPGVVPAAGSSSDARGQLAALKAEALKYVTEHTPAVSGQAIELGMYMDYDFASGRQGEIKQVNVQSKAGDAIVIHNPDSDREVVVLAAKRVAAPSNGRAREYARQLNYTLRKDGDRVVVNLTQPPSPPRDIFVSDVICVVIAPPDVKVVTSSGS